MTDLAERAAAHEAGVRVTRSMPFRGVEMREKPDGSGGTVVNFTGYACATEQGYEMFDMFGPYTEIVRGGAFTKTLSEGADVCFLINHEGMTLARTKSGTLTLVEDGEGLAADASLDPKNPTVAAARSAMERGDMDEMSFAFRVTRQQWSPDYDQRDILEVNIDKGDVSLVNYGANPFTSAALRSLRAQRAPGVPRRAYLAALTELRAGKALSASTMTTLQQVLDLVADADSHIDQADDDVDQAQEVLAALMGVPNPDPPDPEDQQQNSVTQPHALLGARTSLLRLSAS